MRRREGEVLQAIRSAHQFIGDHAPRFPTVAETGAYRELGAVLKRLEQHAVQQSSRDLLAQSATQAHRAARLALFRDHMLPIVAIARALAPDHPGMRVLKMPRHYLPPEILIAQATALATTAAQRKDDFVGAGLPSDFVERMEAAVQHFRAATGERLTHRSARAGATTGVRTELSRARKLLNVMDAFVTTAIHHKPDLLAEWQSVKRLPRPKQARVAIAAPAEPRLLPASTGPTQAMARIAVEDATPAGLFGVLRRLLPRTRHD